MMINSRDRSITRASPLINGLALPMLPLFIYRREPRERLSVWVIARDCHVREKVLEALRACSNVAFRKIPTSAEHRLRRKELFPPIRGLLFIATGAERKIAKSTLQAWKFYHSTPLAAIYCIHNCQLLTGSIESVIKHRFAFIHRKSRCVIFKRVSV